LGLAKIISDICKPGSFNEWDCPFVVAMYRFYCWKESLGAILQRWTPENIFKTFPDDVLGFSLSLHLLHTDFYLLVAKVNRSI
jgi:hypothetical protein